MLQSGRLGDARGAKETTRDPRPPEAGVKRTTAGSRGMGVEFLCALYGARADGSTALNCSRIRSSAPRSSTVTERCAR